jgi:hypothetical protein
MSGSRVRLLLLTISALLFAGGSPSRETPKLAESPSPSTGKAGAAAALAKMPIRFEANAGQHDASIRFTARRGATGLALRDDGATLVIQQRTTAKKPGDIEQRANKVVLGFAPDGARKVTPQASNELVTKTNYFLGNDRSKWRRDVPSYATVTYPSVLDGVDLVYHGENGELEYDFVVAPGANVDRVAMNVEGASKVSLTDKGELRIHTYAGDVVQPPPVVYQRDASGAKHTIASSYQLVGERKVGFKVSSYDRAKPLVIDPVIAYATYLGGTGYDEITALAADGAGNTYVAGRTQSIDFPTANAFDPTFSVYLGCQECSQPDAFVAKLDPTGSQLLYSTFLGGYADDIATGIAIANDGTAYVTGTTSSYDFPLEGAINSFRFADGFVTRLNVAGNDIAFSTFLSGNSTDHPTGIAVDATGIYVAGWSRSTDLTEPPSQPRGGAAPQGGASGSEDEDAFVLKLTPGGVIPAGVLWLKWLGGGGTDRAYGMALDATGRVTIAGDTYSGEGFPQTATPLKETCDGELGDAFVARLNSAGTTFDYVTCLGGNGGTDSAFGVAVDATGNAYVTGATNANDFPVVGNPSALAGNDDVFVSKLNPAGTALLYSIVVGGAGNEEGVGIALDSSNSAWITGYTSSENFPTVAPIQPTYAGGGGERGQSDAFVSRVNASGSSLIFSTFYGGTTDTDRGTAIFVQGSSVHVAGSTYSTNLPILNARQQTNAGSEDGFVAKLSVPPLLISPPTVLVPVGQTQQFTAVGGTGFGYTFSFQGPSGGNVNATGLYTAGPVGSVIDTVTVTDAAGVTASATVQVGAGNNTTALSITPTSASAPPRGQRTFTANGGVPPYSFGFASNASNATVTGSGVYSAGSKGNVIDVVRLTDSVGSTAQATITVGAGITIAPASPAVPPNGSVSFTATGGSGTGYTWTIPQNGSGGTIGSTGNYNAGNGSNTVDRVEVTDSFGNKGSVNVSVGGGLAVTPSDPTTTTRGAITFTAVGGSGSFTWSLTSAPSGGTIDPGTGAYVAGVTGNTIDTVRVQDSVGNSAAVVVSVGPALTLTPKTGALVSGATLAFSATGGSGVGYAYTLDPNASGGSIDASGIYTAGPNSGSDVVRLVDSLGNADTATVTVTAVPNGTLPDGGTIPGFDAGTIPGLNIGGGGVNEDCTCRAVGTSNRGTHGFTGGIAALALALALAFRRRRRD